MKKLIVEIIIIILVFILGMITQHVRHLLQEEADLAKQYGINQNIITPQLHNIGTTLEPVYKKQIQEEPYVH